MNKKVWWILSAIPVVCFALVFISWTVTGLPDFLEFGYALISMMFFVTPAGIVFGPLSIVKTLKAPRKDGDAMRRWGAIALGTVSTITGVCGILFWAFIFWLGSAMG